MADLNFVKGGITAADITAILDGNGAAVVANQVDTSGGINMIDLAITANDLFS